MKLKAFLLSALLLLSLLPGCTTRDDAQVAATTLPVYQFTSMLCQGTDISVTRLITENVSCLHDYALNVSQVQTVESAQVVIISGGGLEDFMHDLLADAQAVIDSSKDIEPLDCQTSHEHAHAHDHHHETDAHFWLSPAHAKQMATNICNGLCQQFPQHQQTFQANLLALHNKLDALLTYGKTQLQELQCRELVTFHDGFAYFAQAFDLTVLEAIEEESGSEASAQELIHLIDLVRSHNLPAVFTETNGSASAADIIARETGAKIYALDMVMAGQDYFEAMYHNIDTIREALG
jgi:ABC-type Zn uptake system ZnuABC Zn-binding protein ZnuA